MGNLSYPQIKADLDLCQTQLAELCNGEHNKAIMSVPPQATDFDMQISAAFDEVKAYRNTGLTPEEITVLIAESTVSKMEIATLKKALELAIGEIVSGQGCCKEEDDYMGRKVYEQFIQQAQEQEGNHE